MTTETPEQKLQRLLENVEAPPLQAVITEEKKAQLEKKWISVVRLQKKVVEIFIEKKNFNYHNLISSPLFTPFLRNV